MHLVMVGTGYVGLVSGTCFAELGWNVTCVDNDRNKIDRLNRGEVPIHEPGLAEILRRQRENGRLQFSADIAVASTADIVFMAVGTPMQKNSGHADLSIMMAAVKDLARALSKDTIVVVKSTVPVGSCAKIAALLAAERPDLHCRVVSNPEFLREGAAIADFMQPDRIIVGTEDEEAIKVMRKIYGKFTSQNIAPLLFTSIESAELIKYAANAFLATKIAFVNEMADLCEAMGADIHEVSVGMGMDSRIGEKFLRAGPGYGGSCFPKDTHALAAIAREHGSLSRITEAVIIANDQRKLSMAQKIVDAAGGDVQGKRIAILGLTFKAGTDDMRDSPSLAILPDLLARGATIAAFDPEGMEQAEHLLPATIHWASDVDNAVAEADAVVILTEWPEFATIDFDALKAAVRTPLLVDLRNLLDRKLLEDAGFTYVCIGHKRPDKPTATILPQKKTNA